MFKCTCQFTALHLEKIWTGTRSVLSSFLISTNWFLVLTNAFRIGSLFACSAACSTAAERKKLVNRELLRKWPKTAQHRGTAIEMNY